MGQSIYRILKFVSIFLAIGNILAIVFGFLMSMGMGKPSGVLWGSVLIAGLIAWLSFLIKNPSTAGYLYKNVSMAFIFFILLFPMFYWFFLEPKLQEYVLAWEEAHCTETELPESVRRFDLNPKAYVCDNEAEFLKFERTDGINPNIRWNMTEESRKLFPYWLIYSI